MEILVSVRKQEMRMAKQRQEAEEERERHHAAVTAARESHSQAPSRRTSQQLEEPPSVMSVRLPPLGGGGTNNNQDTMPFPKPSVSPTPSAVSKAGSVRTSQKLTASRWRGEQQRHGGYGFPGIVGLNPQISQEERDASYEAESVMSNTPRRKNVILRQLRNMGGKSRATMEADQLEEDTPEPLPFQTQVFKVQVVGMSLPSLNRKDESDEVPFTNKSTSKAGNSLSDRSSTQLKKHGVDRRHGDLWGQDQNSPGSRSRGFFLHSERMAWDESGRRSPDSSIDDGGGGLLLSRRSPQMMRPTRKLHSLILRGSKVVDKNAPASAPCTSPTKPEPPKPKERSTPTRLPSDLFPPELTPSEFEELANIDRFEAEAEFMRQFRRSHGMNHREPIDLLMGGQKVMLFERMDILGELARLKSLSLPAKAKELYVGRGFKLPSTHTLNKPPQPRKFSASSNMTATTAKSSQSPAQDKGSPLPYLLRGKQNSRIPPFSPTKRTSPGVTSRSKGGATPQSPIKPSSPIAGYKSHRSRGPASIPEDPLNDDSAYDSAPPGMETTTDTDTDGEQLNQSRQMFYDGLAEATLPEEEDIIPVNPLQINKLEELFAMRNLEEMRTIFRTISLDVDGVIEYSHIERNLPEGLTGAERRYMKELHQATTSAAPFGEDEFVCLRLVSEKVVALEGEPKKCFETLNFEILPMEISKYAGLYQKQDRGNLGTISVTSLQEILSDTISPNIASGDGSFKRITNLLGHEKDDDITKIDYVAWIPFFTKQKGK